MDSTPPLPSPRKALFKSPRVTSKHSQTAARNAAYKKSDLNNKIRLQFEQELEVDISLKCLEKKMHLQRLENLRHLAEKLKEDAWMYPDLEAKLGL